MVVKYLDVFYNKGSFVSINSNIICEGSNTINTVLKAQSTYKDKKIDEIELTERLSAQKEQETKDIVTKLVSLAQDLNDA